MTTSHIAQLDNELHLYQPVTVIITHFHHLFQSQEIDFRLKPNFRFGVQLVLVSLKVSHLLLYLCLSLGQLTLQFSHRFFDFTRSRPK